MSGPFKNASHRTTVLTGPLCRGPAYTTSVPRKSKPSGNATHPVREYLAL